MTTQVRFGISSEGLLDSADDEFLAAVEWRGAGPKQLAGKRGDSDISLRTIGLCWKQQTGDRSMPKLSQPAELSSLNDALQAAEPNPVLALLRDVRKAVRKSNSGGVPKRLVSQLDRWLGEDAAASDLCPDSLLACVELLVIHGGAFPAATVGRLWKVALSAAIDQAGSFEEAGDGADWEELAADEGADQRRWLLAGLLPWACGLLFDEVKGAPKLLKAGRKHISDQLLLVTDEDGSPVGPALENISAHLARWKDALLLSAVFDRALWKDSADERLAETLQAVSATLGADGRICGCLHDDGAGAGLVVSLAELSGIGKREPWHATARKVRDAVEAGLPCADSAATRRKIRSKDIPSWQSDDAEVACLRSSWVPGSSVATLTYHEDPVGLELVADGVPFLVGPWGLSLQEDGDDVEIDDAWECICWYTDGEVDYLELQLDFDDGSKLGRSVMLPRGRQFAVIADFISGSNAKRLELTSELPLADGITGTRRKGTREWRLKSGRDRFRVLPLNVPQDAGIGTSNKAEVVSDEEQSSLVTTSVSETGGVFSPLVLDWSPERRSSICEWSPLTVSEVLNIDRDGAAAWRVRFGDEHLVIFRALRATDRYRTVLGYQTEHETVIADFTKSGDFRELLLVE